MVYTKELKLVEVVQEGGEEVLKLNYEPMPYIPSIEDNPLVMMDAIDKLIENPSAARISFAQRRRYNYSYEQTKMLVEIANIYSYFIKSKRATSLQNLGLSTDPPELLGQRLSALQYLLTSLLKQDPLSAYAELKRAIRRETINLKTIEEQRYKDSVLIYLRILQDIFDQLEKTTLIAQAREYLAGYTPGDREVYKLMFRPTITPDFMYSKIAASPPLDGEQLDIYKLNSSTDISIFRTPNEIKNLYHMTPPEFKLSEDKFELLDLAKKVLSEHQPQAGEFLDPERMRGTFTNISKDLIRELAEQRGMLLKPEEIAEMAEILVRHTIGFGVIELLLEDEKIQDITINSPMGQVPIFILHSDHNECTTNIIPTSTDFESWATKFRLISGRPLDEANPILDTEIITPKARSRLSVIGKPLNPYGYGMSFRRHRDTPWTLPLFIKNGMISPLGAGLLSFTIDGARAHLIAGTRSSGKTSFLSSLLLEIMRKYRVLTIEDTLELPTDSMRKLGYNIQPLKVRAALVKSGSEISAEEGIRTSLRLGDSALIVGEVRSTEAVALFEAMRIGASANVVAGTIHADSPYGVFDRIANDLKVPKTSFKATDIIIICNPIRSADGMKKVRRVLSITEVRKEWEEDPVAERGFVDLMRYNAKKDILEPTPELMNGESEILKGIGANVREWVGNWDAIWDNIVLRADLKKMLVDYSDKTKMPELLEAEFSLQGNDMFHRITESVQSEVGSGDTKRIKFEWEEWLKREIRKKQLG
ncbi:MAG TPA: Flp pilus assembly complex ATPase component TadA [Nanoarchaeota archaeon]|nr:Flp pilus assembly complex ATPase component TadA [Candidatus Woesearchaeota archaeon]HIH15765.1 Flp pilus assembly complex ATPase component TadA [Nanoarchaeota archaeon]HIH58978.1 Flp pilus assembly complex ATPase component TadA [Nanoarchaeota archaeon]